MRDLIWEVIGFTGAGCFVLRWVVHLWYRRRTASARVPSSFWIMSLAGGVMTSAYFWWGVPNRVGFLQSMGPLVVTVANLYLDWGQRRGAGPVDAADTSVGDG